MKKNVGFVGVVDGGRLAAGGGLKRTEKCLV